MIFQQRFNYFQKALILRHSLILQMLFLLSLECKQEFFIRIILNYVKIETLQNKLNFKLSKWRNSMKTGSRKCFFENPWFVHVVKTIFVFNLFDFCITGNFISEFFKSTISKIFQHKTHSSWNISRTLKTKRNLHH